MQQFLFQFFGGFHTGHGHHIGFDPLDAVGVFYANDAGQQHLLMAVNHIFQLRGVDVIAGGNNHPLDPLAEIDEAVLIHPAQVAGVQPDPAFWVAAQGLAVS